MRSNLLSNISNITNATINLNKGDNNSINDQIAVLACVGVFILIVGLWIDGVFDCDNSCRFFGRKNPTAHTPLLAVTSNNTDTNEEAAVYDAADVRVETMTFDNQK